MSNWMLRVGSICVLVPGTLGALAGTIGVGPSGVSRTSEALVLLGFVGVVVLYRRGALVDRQDLT